MSPAAEGGIHALVTERESLHSHGEPVWGRSLDVSTGEYRMIAAAPAAPQGLQALAGPMGYTNVT